MKKSVGWIFLGLIWGGAAIRWFIFPADLHGDYQGAVRLMTDVVDALLIMPPWFLLQHVVPPHEAPWVYLASTVVYLVGLSMLVHVLLIRTRRGP